MKTLIYILAILTLFSCGDGDRVHGDKKKKVKALERKKDSKDTAYIVFELLNDTLRQSLSLKLDSTNRNASFKIESRNSKGNLSTFLTGVAIEKAGGDLESDEDENGEAYFVKEYISETKDCYIALRIEMETQSLAKVKIGDCEEKNNIKAPLESVGLLKRKK